MKKLSLLALLAVAIVLFFYFDLQQQFTLAQVKQQLDGLLERRDQAPLLFAGAFFVLYVLMAALSLPGAAILTLVAGALFGVLQGLLLVSFASSIGAVLAFLVARYLFHDAVQERFGQRLKAINEGVQKDGAFYLFTLRLIPVFPFFVINLVMGLTPIKAWTFYWVSQLGMLAGTAVYVNAGTQLAQIDSLAGILSPPLLLSFVLLGLFPWIARLLVDYWRRRRVYSRWRIPRHFDRNLIVIGAGAAGLVSALIAATVRARVTLVEAHKMGGDCLNTGCVPSKALISSARVAHHMRHAALHGFESVEPQVNFPALMQRLQNIVRTIEPHDSVERYTGLGVDVVQGYARLTDPWSVEIELPGGERRRLTSRAIVIAAGAAPIIPELPGLQEAGYVTSETLWDHLAQLPALPRQVVVLGGGPIGCELSQALARLGSRVTQVVRGHQLLKREDADVSDFARTQLEHDGVRVLLKQRSVRCVRDGNQSSLVIEGEAGEQVLAYDLLICAIGRKARLSGFGLEELGIDTEATVVTDAYLATVYPNIYAAGDVAGPYQFTHVAAHQAWYASVNALFGGFKRFKADYRVIPAVTFMDPEVARVGLNETEALAQAIPFEVTRYELGDLDRAIAESAGRGFVKVLTAPGKDRILGATIVGEHAGELLSEFVLAMRWNLGLNKIMSTIHSYPTLAEANKFAAGEWKRAHAPTRLLDWVERFHNWRR
jgi:pyruvate/2-oxoglutarate dehydrogenase complex dihydrolipoamide dehydrogenase (E3) component/uncharacterized membrane protein YdjX (TVP38/TMEM64 family)